VRPHSAAGHLHSLVSPPYPRAGPFFPPLFARLWSTAPNRSPLAIKSPEHVPSGDNQLSIWRPRPAALAIPFFRAFIPQANGNMGVFPLGSLMSLPGTPGLQASASSAPPSCESRRWWWSYIVLASPGTRCFIHPPEQNSSSRDRPARPPGFGALLDRVGAVVATTSSSVARTRARGFC